MKFTKAKSVSTFLFVFLFSHLASAQNAVKPFELHYPELEVTPLASRRIETEKQIESETNQFAMHLPLEASALATLATSISVFTEDEPTFSADQKTQARYAATGGLVISGISLATATYMALRYRPYESAAKELEKLSVTNRRDQLTKERFAEEAINKADLVGRKLTWIAVGSNLLASGFMIASAESKGAKAMGIFSALASFAPVIFEYRWQTVARQHELYKKRIYGPLVSSGVGLVPTEQGSLVPTLTALIRF